LRNREHEEIGRCHGRGIFLSSSLSARRATAVIEITSLILFMRLRQSVAGKPRRDEINQKYKKG
jgi:hypothetical protein